MTLSNTESWSFYIKAGALSFFLVGAGYNSERCAAVAHAVALGAHCGLYGLGSIVLGSDC